MKKRLEAELISIAHRILKLKNKSEVDQLYKETQKLYETLAVLKFYQDNFESVKEDVDASVLDEKVEQHLNNETPEEVAATVKTTEEEPTVVEMEPEIVTEDAEEETIIAEETEEEVEPVLDDESEEVVAENEPETIDEEETEERIEIKNDPEEIAEQPVVTPMFELATDDEDEQIEPAETASEVTAESKQVALEELLGGSFVDPVFVKPNEVSSFATSEITETKEENESKSASLNAAFSKTLEIGLNDRIAFVNNLFGESNEDFNRVISQLNTFDSLEEAKSFLNEMVIPDYNYWVGKEEYIERFMAILEKKFA